MLRCLACKAEEILCACLPLVQYDTDVTTWSPQGRLFQLEYAMEAVKQGSCSVGLVVSGATPRSGQPDQTWQARRRSAGHSQTKRAETVAAREIHVSGADPGACTSLWVCLQSNTHAVLATLKRSQNEMSSYQRKLFKIDDHMGIAISGLTGDGRSLVKYMRNECINHR